MGALLTGGNQFVVVDVETTGVFNADRVVEIATVTLDGSGRIVDEWDTLVDPQRDVGPVHLHRITASMVSAAPRFEEVAAFLAEKLSGCVLVGHNLQFDARMLGNEFARADATLDPGQGVCTLRLSGGKLEEVCRRQGVELSSAHRALADARATARLFARLAGRAVGPVSAARVLGPPAAYRPRTLTRDMVGSADPPMPYLARLASRLQHHGARGPSLAYMDLLDWVLADLVITVAEADELAGLAYDLGLTAEEVGRVHLRYLDELVAAALRDGVVTDGELDLLHRTAAALGIAPSVVDSATRSWRPDRDTVALTDGMRVCFTGEATGPDGRAIARSELKDIAVDLGLEPVSSVTRSGCDLLVAADVASQSGKAEKARRYGIPLVAAGDFLLAQPGGAVPAVGSGRTGGRASTGRGGHRRGEDGGGTRRETLVCQACGRSWRRAVQRGRKPRTCPDCR